MLILDLLDPLSCPDNCDDENSSILRRLNESSQSSSSREFLPSENDEPIATSDDVSKYLLLLVISIQYYIYS